MGVKTAGKRWGSRFARLGYAAIGLVYALIGALALMGLFGLGGQFSGPGGVARTVTTLPFGRALLAVIVLGLGVYVAWRYSQALGDVEERGAGWQGLSRRAGLLLSGSSYAGLAIISAQWLITGGGTVEDPKYDLTVWLMNHPAGRVAAGLMGGVILGVGLYQFVAAYQAGFMRYVDPDRLGERGRTLLAGLGRFGVFWRGIVFSIIGYFVVYAAWTQERDEVVGLGGVFRIIGRQPYGRWLIGVMAFGLITYGLFMLMKARYRYVLPVDDTPEYLDAQATQQHAEAA